MESNRRIKVIDISSSLIDKLRKLPRVLYLVYAVLRVIIQIAMLFKVFCFSSTTPKPRFVIIQVRTLTHFPSIHPCWVNNQPVRARLLESPIDSSVVDDGSDLFSASDSDGG